MVSTHPQEKVPRSFRGLCSQASAGDERHAEHIRGVCTRLGVQGTNEVGAFFWGCELKVVFALVVLSACGTQIRPTAARKAIAYSEPKDEGMLGPMVTDIEQNQALVWGRCPRTTKVYHVRMMSPEQTEINAALSADTDFTAAAPLRFSAPSTRYIYEVQCDEGEKRSGSFQSPPSLSDATSVRLVWGADVAGGNVCRHAIDGFPIFEAMRGRKPDLFFSLGDMIYADNTCDNVGLYGQPQVPGLYPIASDLAAFWAHWRYVRADAVWQPFARDVIHLSVWDDHEVSNDFFGLEGAAAIGLKAFSDYAPRFPRDRPLYRSLRWGAHVEFFVLDTRSYRDPEQKTMLGAQQLQWLLSVLSASSATWKIIISSVPLGVPAGGQEGFSDSWASYPNSDIKGYRDELEQIMRVLQKTKSHHLWLSADRHYAALIEYTPFADAPSFKSYEVAAGPLNAFPLSAAALSLDPTMAPQYIFRYNVTRPDRELSWAENRRFFNFGEIDIDANGALGLRIINGYGEAVFNTSIAQN